VSAFDFHHHADLPEIESPGPVPPFTERWSPAPPDDQQQPAQEPGTRLARALLYRPEAHAELSSGRLRVVLRDRGDGSTHFAIYGYDGSTVRPVHLDVGGQATHDLALVGSTYDVVVTGPNRFRRDFAGSTDGRAAKLVVESKQVGNSHRLEIDFDNDGTTPLEVEVAPLAYSSGSAKSVVVPPGRREKVIWSAAEAHGWYDVEVTVSGDATFRRRITGHLENGRPSVTG
jgi:phospholipase C